MLSPTSSQSPLPPVELIMSVADDRPGLAPASPRKTEVRVFFEYCSSGHPGTEGVTAARAAAPGIYEREPRPVGRGGRSYGQVSPDVPHPADLEIDAELPWRAA